MILVADIKRAVAEHYGIPVSRLTERSGKREIVRPRQVAMTLSARLTEHSCARIAYFFGKHPNSGLYTMHATEKRRTDPSINTALRSVTRQLLSEAGR